MQSVNKNPGKRRRITSFEPAEDVERMLDRARKSGIKLGFFCNEALRSYLIHKGFAGKKDLA